MIFPSLNGLRYKTLKIRQSSHRSPCIYTPFHIIPYHIISHSCVHVHPWVQQRGGRSHVSALPTLERWTEDTKNKTKQNKKKKETHHISQKQIKLFLMIYFTAIYNSTWRPTNAGWPTKIFLNVSFYAHIQTPFLPTVTTKSRYHCLPVFDNQYSIQAYLPIKSSLDLSLSQTVTSSSWDWSSYRCRSNCSSQLGFKLLYTTLLLYFSLPNLKHKIT